MALALSLHSYGSRFDWIPRYLDDGIFDLVDFVEIVEEVSSHESTEIEYIKTNLLPKIKTAKEKFNAMMLLAEELLELVNKDFEKCVAKLHRREKKIDRLTSQLHEIEIELDRKEDEVIEEEKNCEKKQNELSEAEKTLQKAEEEVKDAKAKQDAVVVGGFAVALGSAIATPFFPPAIVGVFAGASTELSGIYLMENATQERRDQVKIAKGEVSDSKNALEKAKESKEKTKDQLSGLRDQEEEAEEELDDTKREIKKWKKFRKRIIEFNECTKRLYMRLDEFCGRVSVLCLETDGCYSVSCLKKPTLAVTSSLSTLLHCEAIQNSCSEFNLDIMMENLEIIERTKWPAVEYGDFDDLV